MPPRCGGMRKPAEEKALLTELAKMFHVAKANQKELQNAKSAAPASAAAAPAEGRKDARKSRKDARRGSKRRSHHGGSVWMVLKGGFGPRAVPSAAQAAVVDARANQRAVLSEKRRAAALKAAEAYIESAWQQARESDLVNADGTPTEEGDAYLAEQYATAASMLTPASAVAGGFLHQLVDTHSSGASESAGRAAELHGKPTYALSRSEWEDVCTREAAILFRYRTRATPAGTAEDYFKEQQHAREQHYHFATAEPAVASGADVVPTKCIVRIRDSQRAKHTALLSTAKAVNYFKSNIGQVLRKELAASRLPRGGAEDGDGGAAVNAARTHASANAGSSNQSTNVANSAKKRRKR